MADMPDEVLARFFNLSATQVTQIQALVSSGLTFGDVLAGTLPITQTVPVGGTTLVLASGRDFNITGAGDIFKAAAAGSEITLRAQSNDDVLFIGDGFTILDSADENRIVGPKVRCGETGGQLGFFGAAYTAKPTGVAVTAAGIHAALVTLGLIAA